MSTGYGEREAVRWTGVAARCPPGRRPGSTRSLGYSVDLVGGGVLYDRWEVVVPDAFQPIDWFEDES